MGCHGVGTDLRGLGGAGRSPQQRNLQQPVHGDGSEQIHAGPAALGWHTLCGGANPRHLGVCRYDQMLSLGYWPSYNVPFFEKIYNLSGYPAVVKQHGTDDSYELAPRAKIFRRDQTTVVDLDSFKAIMRYNDYKNDPYAKGDPYNAICSRGDLESDSPSPGGCYDTKV